MSYGIPYDSEEGRAICGALSAVLERGAPTPPRPSLAAKSGAFPGYRPNSEAMLASSATTSALPTARFPATRACRSPRRRSTTHRLLRGGPAFDHRGRCGARRLERGAGARGEPRRPKRAGLRRRPDRHHRPRHGSRDDRHRARFRPRQVQEARRRRLFQDHQPRRARRLQSLGYAEAAIEDIVRLCGRPGDAGRVRRAIDHAALKAKGLPEAAIEKVEAALRGAFDIRFVSTSGRSGPTR